MTTHGRESGAGPDRGLLLVLSGPSGVGKTTITRVVRERIADAVFSISATTRPRTSGEAEGVDYFFLTEDEFKARIAADAFLEYASYAGHWYGTLRDQVERALADGKLIMLDIDVQGARQVREHMPEMLGVFIMPPSEDELLERLRHRRREDEAAIQKRFAQAKREIAEAQEAGLYDALIVNDDLDRAVGEVLRLIKERRAEE
jgi:guanylate kinase